MSRAYKPRQVSTKAEILAMLLKAQRQSGRLHTSLEWLARESQLPPKVDRDELYGLREETRKVERQLAAYVFNVSMSMQSVAE